MAAASDGASTVCNDKVAWIVPQKYKTRQSLIHHCEKDSMEYTDFRSCKPTNGIEIPNYFPLRWGIIDFVSLYQMLVFEYYILIMGNTGTNFSLIQY